MTCWRGTALAIIRVGDELVVYSKSGGATRPEMKVASTATPEKPTAQAVENVRTSTSASGGTATHTVARGESASVIAAKYGVGLSDFLRWNGLSKNDVLRVGQTCVVSAPQQGGKSSTANRAEPATRTHKVARGESLWTIAQKYDMDLGDLLAMNGLSKKAVLQAGQSLKVSGVKGSSSSAPAPARKHTVKPGESAWSIAEKHGVGLDDLLTSNGLSKKSVLKAGQELTVPGSGAASKSRTVVHKTTAGQSPSTIAQRYGVSTRDLYSWNNWSKSHVLQIGEEVTIHTP